MELWNNFQLQDFACKCGCPKNYAKFDLIDALQEIRDMLGEPIAISSGYRCEFHNKGVGGSPTSSHITGWAADINITNKNSGYVYRLIKMIYQHGKITRIGYGKMNSGTLVMHVDMDPGKVQNVFWTY